MWLSRFHSATPHALLKVRIEYRVCGRGPARRLGLEYQFKESADVV